MSEGAYLSDENVRIKLFFLFKSIDSAFILIYRS